MKFTGRDGQDYIALFQEDDNHRTWWDVATIDNDGCLVKFVVGTFGSKITNHSSIN